MPKKKPTPKQPEFYEPNTGTPHLLLVWEEIPEKVTLYAIPLDIDVDLLRCIREAHGEIINLTEETKSAMVLNYAVCAEEEYSSPRDGNDVLRLSMWKPAWAGALVRYKIDEAKPVLGTFVQVVLSGFAL